MIKYLVKGDSSKKRILVRYLSHNEILPIGFKVESKILGARRFGDIMVSSNNHSSFSPISRPCGGL